MTVREFHQGKRVFVTGHTGFKGAWLSKWLSMMGAEVTGYALAAPSTPSLYGLLGSGMFAAEFEDDIRSYARLKAALASSAPEVVFHLAAQSLVRRSYVDPLETLTTNAVGTANLLEAVRELELPCSVVIVTTDKCYENREWGYAYRENDALGGHDVYSASKAAAELVTAAWRRSFFGSGDGCARIATARGGNVIGGGDFSEDRIFPDLYRALSAERPLRIRNPNAIRPWQHVLDCLAGYLRLARHLHLGSASASVDLAYNFGPAPTSWKTVMELVQEVLQQWPGNCSVTGNPDDKHEASRLALDSTRAIVELGWQPAWDFETAVVKTVEWYRAFSEDSNCDVRNLTESQLADFEVAQRNANT